MLIVAAAPAHAQPTAAEQLYESAGEALAAGRLEDAYEGYRALLLRSDVDAEMRANTLYGLGATARKLSEQKPMVACEGVNHFEHFLRVAASRGPGNEGLLMDARAGRDAMQRICDGQKPPAEPAVTRGPAQPVERETPVAAWVCAGGALVGAGAGAWLLVLASDSDDDAQDHLASYNAAHDPEEISKFRADAEEADDRATGQRIGAYSAFGVAAVLTGVSIWLFIDDSPAAVSAIPEGGGLRLYGSIEW